MSSKVVSIFVITLVLAGAEFCPALAPKSTCALQVYLPREVVIDGDIIQLGEIGVIRGDEGPTEAMRGVLLGKISVPGQKIVLDRRTILSRLACSGIKTSEVSLTGAERVEVKRKEQVITGRELIEAADAFLKANLPGRSKCQWRPARTPKDVIVPAAAGQGAGEVKLSARMTPGRSVQQVTVKVAVIRAGEQIATRQVPFEMEYKCKRAIALVDIAAGGLINPKNVKVETVTADYPQRRWRSPYGLVAKRALSANSVIRPDAVVPANAPIVVKRGKAVLIRVELPGLCITAIGQALQDGRAGEYIKVRNMDSQRIIGVRINQDGTVEPVF